jgi:uncharacterized protein YjiS (DUF1127 family)
LAPGSAPPGVLADIVGRIASWNDARVTRKALSKLSDRELDDLGLNRGDIDDIAAGRSDHRLAARPGTKNEIRALRR